MSPARQGLAAQVRLSGKRNASSSWHGEGHRPSCEYQSARNVSRYWHPTSRSRRSQVYLRPTTTIRLS